MILSENTLKNIKKKNELTILLASHNMKEVERLCDNIVMMKQGKIVDNGTCSELILKHGRKNLEEPIKKRREPEERREKQIEKQIEAREE